VTLRPAFALVLLVSSSVSAGETGLADAESEMAKADAYVQQHNYQAAIAHYTAAKQLAPDRPGPYRGLGMAYYSAGKCAEAVPVLEEYVRLKARDPWPQAVRALADCKSRLSGGAREEKPPGTVRITSDPSGAQVRLDDSGGPVLGTTPYDSEGLPTGDHRVYLSAPGYRPTAGDVRVQPGVSATLHVTMQPLPRPSVSAAPTEAQKRELQQYEQSASFEQQLAEQVRMRYEGQKIEVCGSGPTYHFCTQHEQLTENEFVRRYRKLTGARDLDFADRVRNKAAIGVWTAFGLAGVGLLAYGAATYNCDPTASGCDSGKNDTSAAILYSGITVWAISVLGYFVYGGLKFDGTPEMHDINEYDARLYTARFNRALETKIHNDLAAGRLSDLRLIEGPTEDDPARPPRARPAVRVIPYIGPAGVGVVARF
jgi:hypothetical protein